ncbi:MAG: internal scaffolding protein [Microvirus sp.]|nr:MAG: internal scaffolding protein [Microvirus sp.]
MEFTRNAFNYDTDLATRESSLVCLDPTLTQQQFADDADINTIVRRFGLTGQLPTAGAMPTYGDFSDVVDYHTAVNSIRSATEAFMALPGHVRLEFGNDPQRFVEFCSDPANATKARILGLSPDTPLPDINRPVNPPAPPVDLKGFPAPTPPGVSIAPAPLAPPP